MRLGMLLCVFAVAALVLSGCTSSATSTADQQSAANRSYMAQVNQKMEELKTRLAGFNEAVARKDLVSMRTQADNAFRVIDDLSKMTPPDSLVEIQNEYVAGCNDLRDSLNGFISLYSDIQNASATQPFDFSTYGTRLDQINQKYNSGIQYLQSGDQKAVSMT